MMNRGFQQAVRVTQRRLLSTTSTTFLRKAKQETVKKNWFSDPSVYPLMIVMSTAASLVVGVGLSCIFYNPDVQINPHHRCSPVRTWEFN